MSKRAGAVRLAFGVTLVFIVCNVLFAWQLVGLSYKHFTWEAFAQAYNPTDTPTPTSTPTATATPTITPTATPTPTPTPPHEDTGGAQGCSDGIDNDGDGLTDCADPDCGNTPACGPVAPMMSPRMIVVLIVTLGTVGLLGVWAARRRAD